MKLIYKLKYVFLFLSIMGLLAIPAYSQNDSTIIKEKYNAYIVDNEEEDQYIDGGFLVRKGKKYGVVDYDYNLIIPIKYKSIKYIGDYNEYYIVNRKKYYGIYNTNWKEILECKYTSIEDKEDYGLKIKSKKGVGWYSFNSQKILIEDIYDSIVIDSEMHDIDDGIFHIYKDNKIGMFSYEYEDILFNVEWDSIQYVDGEIYDIEGYDYYDYYRLKRNDSVFYYTGNYEDNSQIVTTGYSTANRKRLLKLNADTIDLDMNNGDGLFNARNAISKKWGMYQDYGDTIHILIPPQFDSIVAYSWNAPYTMVANNGLWGVYLWDWGRSDDAHRDVAFLYQDYKRVTSNSSGRFYLAAMIDDKWFWVDWYTGKKTTKQVWDSYDEMELSYYDRSTYYSN